MRHHIVRARLYTYRHICAIISRPTCVRVLVYTYNTIDYIASSHVMIERRRCRYVTYIHFMWVCHVVSRYARVVVMFDFRPNNVTSSKIIGIPVTFF